MPKWITQSGILSEVGRGDSVSINLVCTDTEDLTYKVISGSLPNDLTLSAPEYNGLLPYPTIWGVIQTSTPAGTYGFNIRATNNSGEISDRSFFIVVSNSEPYIAFPNSNLGIFPDGLWMFANVAPISSLDIVGNIHIVEGSLPSNLSLDANSGIIKGYVNPDNLYILPTSANVPSSIASNVYSFTVGYGSNVTSDYNMTIMRSDLYFSNIPFPSGAVYHAPIFPEATFNENPYSAFINLGNITGDSIFYQFVAEDFENDVVNYQLINGANIPGDISLNANTGWLTGHIDINNVNITPYTFEVRAYKAVTEPITGTNPYQTIMPVIVNIQPPFIKNIVWNSNDNLGNIIPGIPSTISINASVINPFTVPAPIGAKATVSMQLIGVDIIDGGTNFSNGIQFNVPGGTCVYAAAIQFITTNGVITNAIILNENDQQYTDLPLLNNVLIPNANNGVNALVNLNFGVDLVYISDGGTFYDDAIVGFSDAGQLTSAKATATINNGQISGVNVTDTGSYYTAVPTAIINGKATITATNPIKYELTDGRLPNGLKLLSNGLLVGMASAQTFNLDADTAFDTNNTNFDNIYDFTVTAYVGSNAIDFVAEENIVQNNNIVMQEFQTLITLQKSFKLTVEQGYFPQTNLSLEFLLSDTDRDTLFLPLNDQSLVPNNIIYREDDFYYGIQNNARILMAYGIPPVHPGNITASMAKYHHNKRFLFTNLKWAQSTSENYEVIYIQPVDEFTDINGNTYTGEIFSNNLSLLPITADTDIYLGDSYIYDASDTQPNELYPATIPNMINRLMNSLGAFDYRFLPSWMTDTQPNGNIIGFIPAIPLLYVKSGYGKKVMFYLQQYYNNIGPALNTINAETDRYIWNFGFIKNWDITANTWVESEITTFDVNSNSCTSFGNSAIYDVSDEFLYEDDGSIYLKFRNSTFIPQSVVEV